MLVLADGRLSARAVENWKSENKRSREQDQSVDAHCVRFVYRDRLAFSTLLRGVGVELCVIDGNFPER